MIDTIRVWKDAAYRKSLITIQLAEAPAHPAGGIELSDTELDAVTGGMMRRSDLTSLLSTCTSGTDSCCC